MSAQATPPDEWCDHCGDWASNCGGPEEHRRDDDERENEERAVSPGAWDHDHGRCWGPGCCQWCDMPYDEPTP